MRGSELSRVVLIFAFVCCAYGDLGVSHWDGFAYVEESNALTVTGVWDTSLNQEKLVIPDHVNGIPVRSVGPYAFAELLSNTQTIIISTNIVCIGDWAFYQCSGLTNISISANVTNIGIGAFGGCSNLVEILVSDDNSIYASENGVLLDKGKSRIIQFPGAAGGLYSIPYNVGSVAPAAYFSCPFLEEISIHGGVTNIGEIAFGGSCSSLTNIHVSTSNEVFSSRDGVLFCKSQVTLIRYPPGINAFNYEVPDTVESIDKLSFDRAIHLASISVPESVMAIDDGAFYNCTSLTAVYFRGDAPTLGTNVFLNAVPTVYYQEGANGFGDTFGGRPTAVWVP